MRPGTERPPNSLESFAEHCQRRVEPLRVFKGYRASLPDDLNPFLRLGRRRAFEFGEVSWARMVTRAIKSFVVAASQSPTSGTFPGSTSVCISTLPNAHSVVREVPTGDRFFVFNRSGNRYGLARIYLQRPERLERAPSSHMCCRSLSFAKC